MRVSIVGGRQRSSVAFEVVGGWIGLLWLVSWSLGRACSCCLAVALGGVVSRVSGEEISIEIRELLRANFFY